MQCIPVRDAVKQSHRVEIRIDFLASALNKIREPVLPSVMQLVLNIPRNSPVCFDVPLVQPFQNLRPVNRKDLPRV